jgi:predicted MFS family arabinose efflux permease
LRLSGLAAGVIVDHFGYSAAFSFAGAAAILTLAVFAIRMPETAEPDVVSLYCSFEIVIGPSRQTAFR